MSLLDYPALSPADDDPDIRLAMTVVAELLEDGCWRLVDTRVAPCDADHVVGCVTETLTGFDVIWLRPGYALATFATLDDVLTTAELLIA